MRSEAGGAKPRAQRSRPLASRLGQCNRIDTRDAASDAVDGTLENLPAAHARTDAARLVGCLHSHQAPGDGRWCCNTGCLMRRIACSRGRSCCGTTTTTARLRSYRCAAMRQQLHAHCAALIPCYLTLPCRSLSASALAPAASPASAASSTAASSDRLSHRLGAAAASSQRHLRIGADAGRLPAHDPHRQRSGPLPATARCCAAQHHRLSASAMPDRCCPSLAPCLQSTTWPLRAHCITQRTCLLAPSQQQCTHAACSPLQPLSALLSSHPPLLWDWQERDLPQARGPAACVLLQAARRVQQDVAAVGR